MIDDARQRPLRIERDCLIAPLVPILSRVAVRVDVPRAARGRVIPSLQGPASRSRRSVRAEPRVLRVSDRAVGLVAVGRTGAYRREIAIGFDDARLAIPVGVEGGCRDRHVPFPYR